MPATSGGSKGSSRKSTVKDGGRGSAPDMPGSGGACDCSGGEFAPVVKAPKRKKRKSLKKKTNSTEEEGEEEVEDKIDEEAEAARLAEA
jgi:hypothetical protein